MYIGEHLLPGQIGHFFIIVSLVASLVATISFFKANISSDIEQKRSWLKLGRLAFLTDAVSIIAIFYILYHLISNHYFEYKYVWQHSSMDLQFKYLLSCFWEGQEGSFMLWAFWHAVLGGVLIKKAGKWEAATMTIVSFAQFCLATMVLGIYVFGIKIGSNPFVLMRNEGMLDNAPILLDASGALKANYLEFLTDGSGLNTLLQNYWMVIHPPVLFLGFASTIVPFAFAYAGLVNKDHSWIKPAIPYTVFSAAALGLGIMMGAAWAYESLTFGGYWAWDPVENASLVPWLILIAGLHTNLIARATGRAYKSTYLFYILGFVLILYSTFLTRSGVLGDTSVHAFTGADMTTQLVCFVLVFFIPAITLFFVRNSTIPTVPGEENTYSREFWMFIGSLVFFLSAVLITSKTSIPVFNLIFKTKIAPPEDPEFAHNSVQVFIAIIIGILTAITQFFKYKNTSKAEFGKKILWPTLLSLAISLAIILLGKVNYGKQGPGFMIAIHLSIFAAVYAVIANGAYILLVLKGKIKAAGASVAHIGFALMLVGILISSSKKTVLSWNTTGLTILDKEGAENPAENISLFKGIKTDMGLYNVTYVRDTINEKEKKQHFEIAFEKKSNGETFMLYPNVMKNNKGAEGFSANPDARHYLTKDIFVYVTSFLEAKKNDTTSFKPIEMKIGDTAFYSNGMLVLNEVQKNPDNNKRAIEPGESALMFDFTVISKEGFQYRTLPGIAINPQRVRNLEDTVVAQSLILKFDRIVDADQNKFEFSFKENKTMNDLITLKVYEFPFINLLWLGIVIMTVGFVMSIVQRVKRG